MEDDSILLQLFKYPTVSAVLANVPLPDLTDEEFWEQNFVQVRDRPAKRIGIEFKTYMEFHRSDFPTGKVIGDQDIIRVMRMTEKEKKRLPLIWEYLKSRKAVQKQKDETYKVSL